MTSETPPPTPTPPPPPAPKRRLRVRARAHRVLERLGLQHFHRIVAMLLATATLAIAIVTYLEVEAHSKAETSGADAQLRQIEASTREINGKAQIAYDWTTAYRTWVELDLQAESADEAGNTIDRDRFLRQRDLIRFESRLLDPEYFTPQPDAGTTADPDLSRYEVETYYRDVQVLNEQADGLNEIKEFWHKKQTGFLTALAFLSSALFISGLALTTPRPLARGLLGIGTLMIVGATGYATVARLGNTPQLHETAIQHYAEGKSLAYRASDDDGYNQAIGEFTKALDDDDEYVNARVARADAHVNAGIYLFGTQQKDAEEHFHAAIEDFAEARDLGHDDAHFLWNIGWVYYLLGDYDHAIALDTEAVTREPDLFAVRHNLGLAYLVRGKDGDLTKALAAFDDSKNSAVSLLTGAAGEVPNSTLADIEDMGVDFENLQLRLSGLSYTWIEAPAAEKIKNADQVKDEAIKQRDTLANLVARYDIPGAPSAAANAAPASKHQITNFTVTGHKIDNKNRSLNTQTGTVKLDAGTTDIVVDADFDGMDGVKRIAWRVSRNGYPDRLLTHLEAWTLGNKGRAEVTIGYSYTSLWHYKPGYYAVEFYADNVLLGRTTFTVGDP